MLTVYLAGPDVFLPDAIAIGQRKKQLCAAYGFEGLYPFDNDISPAGEGERVDRLIYRANVAMMRRADFGICNLTPFRGPSADAGTVFELGFMTGLGKPVFAYTNDAAHYPVRARTATHAAFDQAAGTWRDASGMMIEDFGNADNLMIDWAVLEHARCPIVRPARPIADRFRDLDGFETCLRRAADAMI
jgi:nucleoside 2-deoxyribosyltransferase